MSRCNWRSNAAIVGWLTVGLLCGLVSVGIAQTPDGPRITHGTPSVEGQSSTEANSAQSAPEEFSIPIWNFGTSDDTEHAKEREEKSDNHDAFDLVAQQEAAEAARTSANQARKQTRFARCKRSSQQLALLRSCFPCTGQIERSPRRDEQTILPLAHFGKTRKQRALSCGPTYTSRAPTLFLDSRIRCARKRFSWISFSRISGVRPLEM